MKLLSSLLYILAILLLLPLVIAAIYGEGVLVYQGFIISALISAVIASIFKLITIRHKTQMTLSTSMIFCYSAWFIISLIGSLPFLLILKVSVADGLFEAVSGFTTTGITVFQGLDGMSHAVLFWRSLIQWVGGLGILTFFLFVTASGEGDMWQLFTAEGHKISSSRPVPNVYRTIRWFWIIYGGYTLAEIIILKLLGLSFYDAIIHSFTTLSTGGFSNHDASIGYYQMAGYANYIWIEYTFIIFMILGGVNFLVHYRMLKESPMVFFKDIETKVFLRIIGVFSLATILGIIVLRGLPIGEVEVTIRKTLFQIVSVMTTTGFGTENIGGAFFPAIAKQLFIILMLVGGSVGSTAGGLKVLRIIVLERLLNREVKKLNLPGKAVLPVTVGGVVISQDEIRRISALVFGWLLLIGCGAAITALFSDLGPFEALSGMASAVGNIGPFYFSVAKMTSLSWVIKLTYIIGMLAGRLELLPVYILLIKGTWK
jgi:trk system potassium uptake protein TrkH